jgi:hypothetical protein
MVTLRRTAPTIEPYRPTDAWRKPEVMPRRAVSPDLRVLSATLAEHYQPRCLHVSGAIPVFGTVGPPLGTYRGEEQR